MDRDEALRLLKGGPDGIAEWNRRRDAGEEIPDLREANLVRANLVRANLVRARLYGARLDGARLDGARLGGAVLGGAALGGAALSGAVLGGAVLGGAVFGGAALGGAVLHGAHLNGADLRGAILREANLGGADLHGADLDRAMCGDTIFADVDLSVVKGLETVQHLGPSTVGIDTLFLSRGKIPEVFLRGCGLTPWEILSVNFYDPALTSAQFDELQKRIFDAWTKGQSMINGCFISYSWKDARFVDKLQDRLMGEGVNV